LGVGENDDLAVFLERLESRDGSCELHPIIRGGGLASRDRALMPTVPQNCRPTAWAGISEASPIGEYYNVLHVSWNPSMGCCIRRALKA
jgi:hypothetical protein